MSWSVHKFGGTSVADASRYQKVPSLINTGSGQVGIVVSAMSKVTDALIEITSLAGQQDAQYLEKLDALKQRHLKTLGELLPEAGLRESLVKILEKDFADLKEILRGVWLVRNCSHETMELISGHGEIWSAQFLCAFMKSQGSNVTWLDARKVLVVEPKDTGVNVLWKESEARLSAWLSENSSQFLVITGFVASTQAGTATTLRRNGSDYSASIFGALLKASSISIWTDVDGVLSADPRLVPEAVVLDDLSYEEATELAYFGAKVVHPSTMAPAISRKIPIWIKNTFNPQAVGTLIHSTSNSKAAVKGFATIENVALVNVEGTGMVGVPGVAERLFGGLKDVGVSVVMISQASSEHSICFVIPLDHATRAKEAVAQTFAMEIQNGLIQTIEVSDDCSVLAAVGDNMVHRPGLAGQFMTSLGKAGVNIRAIAQGSSERNISVVVRRSESTRALRAVHAAFFLSAHTLSIGLIGVGGVGKTLLEQLRENANHLRQSLKIDFRVRGVANTKNMWLDERGLDLNQELKNPQPFDLNKFTSHVHADHLPHAVIVDCTANLDVAKQYEGWLKQGVHVITPNKKANTDTLELYRGIKKAAQSSSRHYLYETTVGAGLPILNTLRELVRTGDRVLEIEGIFSGTLSFLFNTFSTQRPFSEVLSEARQRGYTEPDPREDLSGMDVARKLVILGREMGLSLNLSEVVIEPILPSELQTGTVDEFLKRLPQQDAMMLEKIKSAQAQGKVLRFVGRIDEHGKASAGLKTYANDHTFSRLGATDNIVAFRTSRYSQPLIVQGPGAGPDVTAGGVFADLLRLSSYLGAPL